MSDERWIIVPRWDKFQHYTDRDPPWIKLYTELNSNDDWCELTDAERGLLVTIWIEYARSRGILKASRVPHKVGQASRVRQFESLNRAGFIKVVASKPLALAPSRDVKRREEKNRDAASSRSQEPEQRRRQNAGAYHKHHTEQPDETVPIETIEAYLMGLQTPHFTDVADD